MHTRTLDNALLKSIVYEFIGYPIIEGSPMWIATVKLLAEYRSTLYLLGFMYDIVGPLSDQIDEELELLNESY